MSQSPSHQRGRAPAFYYCYGINSVWLARGLLSASSPSRHKRCSSSTNTLAFYFADLAEFVCPISLCVKTLDLSFCGLEAKAHLGQSRPAPDASTWGSPGNIWISTCARALRLTWVILGKSEKGQEQDHGVTCSLFSNQSDCIAWAQCPQNS